METAMKDVIASRIEAIKEARDDIGQAVSDYLQIGADMARTHFGPKEADAPKEGYAPQAASAVRSGLSSALKRVAVPAAVGGAAGGTGYLAGKGKGREEAELDQRKREILERLFPGYAFSEGTFS